MNWSEILTYDPNTGVLLWKHRTGYDRETRRWNARYAGKAAGSRNAAGYLHIKYARKGYVLHRIAWAIQTGDWPPREIDHLNGDRSDNRWTNLRLATRSQNCANQKLKKANKTGFKGVSFNKKMRRYCANIRLVGKQTWIGSFTTAEEAHAAYVAVAKRHFGEFANAG